MSDPGDTHPDPAAPATTRRGFLLRASGLGALGVTAALAGAQPAAEIAASLKKPEAKPSGYQESEHVKTYYRTARYW